MAKRTVNIEMIDPLEEMPDVDTDVLVWDRFGNVIIASWDDEMRIWIESSSITPGDGRQYPWPESHCKLWAHIPEGGSKS